VYDDTYPPVASIAVSYSVCVPAHNEVVFAVLATRVMSPFDATVYKPTLQSVGVAAAAVVPLFVTNFDTVCVSPGVTYTIRIVPVPDG
jgi:hypothetical protein